MYFHKRLKSFQYAWRGVKLLFREPNAKIHLAAAILAITLGFLLKINLIEWAIIIIVIGLVLMAELFNTTIEKLSDRVTTEQDDKIEKIKDMSAGAVLIIAITAAIVGCVIFIPKIYYLF